MCSYLFTVIVNVEHNIPEQHSRMHYNDFFFSKFLVHGTVSFYFEMHEDSKYLPIGKVVNLERFTGVKIMTM